MDRGDDKHAAGGTPSRSDGTAPLAPAPGGYLDARRTRVGGRVNLLFFVPLPLVWRAFTADTVGLALNLGALGLMLLAAWLTREGLRAQEAYEARRLARRPALPRKILGAVLTGAGLALAAFADGGGVLAPAIPGVLGAVLHLLAFGPDPLTDKGGGDGDVFQAERVARVVARAETCLSEMTAAVRRTGDREIEARLERFQRVVRDMARTVEDDPRDLTAARRYLGVYLIGARDASVAFADVYSRTRDPRARSDYIQLLADLEANFTIRTRKLLANNAVDLDIEIAVLRERLEREGVRLGDGT